MSILLIVESPAKAKTLVKYLGSEYVVKASMGHLRDLPKKKIGIDIENDFTPVYQEIDGKDKIISDLKKASDEADFVYLATDPDREGEAISWHLKEMLELDDAKTKRITFNEITKKAVTEAVEKPRDIDMNLVDAQQGRRILDRIVGYQLSPFLWRKVRRGLSAGRVQTVVTRLVVDREREINNFNAEEYWTIDVTLSQDGKEFVSHFHGVETGKLELHNAEETQVILDGIEGKEYEIKSIKNAKKKKRSMPPFITSSLQQDASRKLGMTAKRTMAVAQELYEGVEIQGMGATGLITYMRTDSLRVSDEAIQAGRDFILSRFGKEFLPDKPKVYKTKKGAQDAHEAIRPTNPALTPEEIKRSLTNDQFKLYRLIWSRFIASQMKDATLDTMSIDIECNGFIFRSSGSVVSFPGYLGIYQESFDEAQEEEMPLPPLKEGDKPKHIKTEDKQHFTQPPARYTEASLIKAMEERGIGRPSTYAPTISIITDREYVVKENKTLKPTLLGEAVTDLMVDKFATIADSKFTAEMENKLDEVEHGRNYKDVLREFYAEFDASMKQAEKDLEKTKIKVKDEVTDTPCPNCGEMMVIKSSRFGKFLACPRYPECKTTKPITEDMNVPCPVCGAKLLKKKSKSGYYYYGCEKNPECEFMTWDKPTDKKCPQCGGVVYKKYTKLEKKNLCYTPNCGWEEPLATKRGRKKAEETEGAEEKKTTKKRTSKKADVSEAAAEVAAEKPKRGRKKKTETAE